MKNIWSGLGLLAALAASGASAQGVNLTGQYVCVQLCAPGVPGQRAFVTQNGWNLNLVNEAGEPARAWVDWVGHIWVEAWRQGALYSPNGMTIQFDRGTVWQRDLGEPEIAPPAPTTRQGKAPAGRRNAAPPRRSALNPAAYDGSWSVRIVTASGSCDREYRYGVQIINGNVVYDGSSGVDMRGHVMPNGNVQVSLASGGQQAIGQGQLSQNYGTGTWRGQGFSGACAGVWEATRRG